MSHPADKADLLDDYVQAFEFAYAREGHADLGAFLPPVDHPLHHAVLRELVRVDLEYGWERGCPRDLDEYRRSFPTLANDREGLRQIAFEEFRLRRLAGQTPSTAEYLARFSVRLDPEVGRFRSLSVSRFDPPHAWSPTLEAGRFRGEATGLRLIPSLPEVGDDFLGFRLIRELGQGSFARVYLARQGELADRPVVLKISAERFDESQTLAQLQHENIVPVYSRHRDGALRALCMPYLGSVTLRDLVEDLKGQGALPDSGRGLLGSLSKSSQRKGLAADPPPASPLPATRPEATQLRSQGQGDEIRAILGKLTYVEAVVWMSARLADGLAHAHDRGILHRDMKPANILVTDDGRPMLLDFNLAEDLKRRVPDSDDVDEGSAVGGTLPYMAPEHLTAFSLGGGSQAIDARSDLFAFGVIVFEMLTGRPPFPIREGTRPEVIAAMIADRQGTPPRLRPWNPSVSPAVEAIVRRCLEPIPARRYASARELGEDLQRHLDHRPLKHTAEPSRRERCTKWLRRNRRPLASVVVLTVGLGLLAGLAGATSIRSEHLGRLESRAALLRFRDRSADALNLVSTTGPDRDPLRHRRGLDALVEALEIFHVREPGALAWWDRPPADRLTTAERTGLRGEVGELLLLMSQVGAMEAASSSQPASQARRRTALDDNRRAEANFSIGAIPRSVWIQRAELFRGLGDTEAAVAADWRAETSPMVGAIDLAFLGRRLCQQSRLGEALPLLESAVRLAPDRYGSWLALGNCHYRLMHDDQAAACYTTCIALRPEIRAAWLNRGLVLYRQKTSGPALDDLKTALRMRPDDAETRTNVALAELDLGRAGEALRDLDRAIASGLDQPRLYLMRAEVRARLGDTEGARRDRTEGVRREPVDATGWIARALARIDGDTAGALADLDRALAIDPLSKAALINKTYLYSERLGRSADALAVLDRAVEAYPEDATLRATRAVLRARVGRRDAAIEDIDEALELQATPEIHWQVASAYALTSATHPDDQRLALQDLAVALRRAPGLVERVSKDGDLSALHAQPAYARLIARARAARDFEADRDPAHRQLRNALSRLLSASSC